MQKKKEKSGERDIKLRYRDVERTKKNQENKQEMT